MTRQCAHCGAEFSVQRASDTKKFCTLLCANRAKNEARSATMPVCTCKQCGKEFKARERTQTTFCSRPCSYAYFAQHGYQERRKEKQVPPRNPKCKVCGNDCGTTRRHICSDECRKELARQKAREREEKKHVSRIVTCRECGQEYRSAYGSKRSAYCSDGCMRRATRRASKLVRKARQRSTSAVDSINPIDIFERDGWCCYICRRKTPRGLRGTTLPTAPELDHIVPLAKGGTHTPDNVACCCRACNAAKGDTLVEAGGMAW